MTSEMQFIYDTTKYYLTSSLQYLSEQIKSNSDLIGSSNLPHFYLPYFNRDKQITKNSANVILGNIFLFFLHFYFFGAGGIISIWISLL